MMFIKESIFALGSMIIAGQAYTQDILLSTSIGIDAFHDDQFDVQVDGTDTAGLAYRPNMQFSYEGQRYQSEIELGARFIHFSDSSQQNTQNASLSWDFSKDWESSSFSISAGYQERLVEDLVELDDSSELSSEQTVKSRIFGSGYSRQLSSLNSIEASYQYETVNLEGEALSEDNENIQHGLNFVWYRNLSERSRFGLFLNFVAFRPEDALGQANVETDVYGLSIGGDYQLNPIWEATGYVGASRAMIDDGSIANELTVEDGDTVITTDFSITRTGSRNVITIGFNSGTTQQLDGTVDDQKSASLTWSRQINENIESRANVGYFRAERNDRENFQAEFSAIWAPSERWRYSLGYRYREQLTTIDDQLLEQLAGESNRITITVEYAFDELRFDI